MNNIRLSEYLDEITKGTTPTTIGGRFMCEGVNFVKAECLNTGRIIDKKSLSYISPEIHKKLNRSILKDSDLLFSIAGHLGKMAIVREHDLPANTNQAVAILRINQKKADVEFLYYYLCSKQVSEYISSQCAQSVQPNLNLAQVGELPIIEYPLSYQQKIASVLSALDNKIELYNRINAELEAMAKTLYDYWFVQFDFPDKNGKPYKTSGGKMVWNEELKREIPEGWEVCSVDEYAEVKKGELITAKDAEEGSIKVIAAGVDYSYFHSTPNRLKNTITISGSGANAGFINFWREPIFASDCITVRGKSDSETLILLQYLNFIQPHILSQATGSAQPHVYPSDIKILNYVIPPDKLIEEYGKISVPMNDKIGNNLIENQKLTELRDWLLPMLMNGQVKVS